LIFFEFVGGQQSKDVEKKEVSSHLRIILLAIKLQHTVKKLPSSLFPIEAITQERLTNFYCDKLHLSPKTAQRDLHKVDRIFGLEGSATSGYVMGQRFDRFYDMFVFWIEKLGEPKSTDRRMHVLLHGLIKAIDDGFRDDPIAIPELARDIKRLLGNKNIRDSKEPLMELFSNDIIATYLMLLDDDENQHLLRIDKNADPLLLRLKSRSEVGDNVDISINLARPGRVRSVFDDHTRHLDLAILEQARNIAQAVRESHAWSDESGNMVVPYILFREGSNGPLFLTLWYAEDNSFRDVPIDQISAVPSSTQARFIPHDMPSDLWQQFTQMTE